MPSDGAGPLALRAGVLSGVLLATLGVWAAADVGAQDAPDVGHPGPNRAGGARVAARRAVVASSLGASASALAPAIDASWSAVALSDPASVAPPSGALHRARSGSGAAEGSPQDTDAPVSPGRAALYSVVLPGAGQHALDQSRKWLYLAIEATGWFFYVDRRTSGSELAVAYRDFAWDEARLQTGPRVDGDFDYYERLSKWQRSGAFDADPGAGGIQPETDPATWNGSVWTLAERLFLPGGPSTPPSDPQYQRALEYYVARGYDEDFLWDWTGTGTAQDEYTELIAASDERYRQATNVLGAIIANHVVSAIDAFLSARGLANPTQLRVAPGVPGAGPSRWHLDLRLPVGP